MDDSTFMALSLGFALGLKHATEADHVVAVSSIVSEERGVARSALVGAWWGLGHTAAIFLVGSLVITLRVVVPEGVASALELLVALLILFLGGRVLYLLLRDRRDVHVHPHRHDGHTHSHLHFHEPVDEHLLAAPPRPAHRHSAAPKGWQPLAIGVVHGLAGSAALSLLVLTEVMRDGSRALGMLYLLVFGVGSIGGMLLMSAVISIPFALTTTRFRRTNDAVRFAAGTFSIIFGLFYALDATGAL